MDYMTPPEKLILGDSSGIPIVVASKETWTLETFYQNHGLQPSRYKMYFMLDLQVHLIGIIIIMVISLLFMS